MQKPEIEIRDQSLAKLKVRQILSVVDFSQPSQPAITYAAHLAQFLHATLTLAALPLMSSTSPTHGAAENPLSDQLVTLSKRTAFTYNIACSFDSNLLGISRPQLIERSMRAYQLVVLGMHSLADLTGLVNDCHLLATLAKMPSQVLLAPALHPYVPITHIAYCFELTQGENLSISKLIQLAQLLKCKVHLLQLVASKFNRTLETAIMRQQEEIQELYHEEMVFDFKTIWTKEFAGSTGYFMQTVKADALALSVQYPSFLHDLFQARDARDLASITRYPVVLFN